MYDLLIQNAYILAEQGQFYGALAVKDGKITAFFQGGTLAKELDVKKVVDARGQYLLPGGVDPHVHIRYPGGKLRETFVSGSQAAAAGGVTTIIEHPISSPPQYSPETLQRRVAAAQKECLVDIAFFGAAGAEQLAHISQMKAAGICAFKTFLHAAPEGRDEEFTGLTAKDNFELFQVMQEVAKTGLLMAAHGEDNDMVAGNIAWLRGQGRTGPIAHAESRPGLVEALAVQRLIILAKELKARLYLVHISTPEACELAKQARAEGLDIYIETCPHYLYLTTEDLEREGAYLKCNPALRSPQMAEQLWHYVEDGTIDTVGSDHAPYLVAEKEQRKEDIFVAPAGFPGLETRLGYMLKAVHQGRISLSRAVELISTNPAKAFGLYPRKGAIRLGADADLIMLNPEQPYIAQAADLFTMAKDICHFLDGTELYGKVKQTYVRGEQVFNEGEFTAEPGFGTWLNMADIKEA